MKREEGGGSQDSGGLLRLYSRCKDGVEGGEDFPHFRRPGGSIAGNSIPYCPAGERCPFSQEVLDEIALTRAEYDLIVERLSREPNPVELGMFGALWSEHCGYKHSRPLLRMFSHTSAVVLSETGAENAGAVDIGDGLAVVFKVESHNHPLGGGAVPGRGHRSRRHRARYTGHGRAGPSRCSTPCGSVRWKIPRRGAVNKHLFGGVVRGISWYGNCIGVPDVGGEIYFDPSYSHKPAGQRHVRRPD